MAQKELGAAVVLFGRVDNSFSKIGAALAEAGMAIDGVSRKLIDFGKESIEVYRKYEDSMLETQGALATTYGRGTAELKRVMTQLDAQAAQWASSSIFHTDDIANAINEAAHANWDLEKILTGIPAAMRLAQAGGLDLSEGLNYVIRTSNAAGIAFEDLDGWIDSWAFAANSSAADIQLLGEAMLKMGTTMRFADSNEELLTLLAALHDAGTTGSAAGTLLRNTMIRLIAPTKKAADIMSELEITEGDLQEALGESAGDLDAALESLYRRGFSQYDKNGKLKSFVTIFRDMNKALTGMSEKEKNNILASIFPTRTITGALTLLDAFSGEMNDLWDAFERGDQEGYAEYLSETAMSGLTGPVEILKSQREELERVVGKNLAPQVETIAGNLGSAINTLSEAGQDSNVSKGLTIIEKLSGLASDLAGGLSGLGGPEFDSFVAGLGTLATLGGGLTTTGFGIGLIGRTIGWKTSALILGATAITSVVEAIKAYNESEFEDKFGDLELDTAGLNEYLGKVREPFEQTTSVITGLKNELETVYSDYLSTSGKFANTMINDLLTKKELTQDDLNRYYQFGEDMVKQVVAGVYGGTNLSAEFWAALFTKTGEDTPDISNPAYLAILNSLMSERDDLVTQAEGIGKDLRDAITKAFENDGVLDEEEYARIKDYYRQLNEIMAQAQREAQSEQDYINQQKLLHKAQSVSLDSMEAWINGEVIPQRDEQLKWWEENYLTNRWTLQYRKQKEIEEAQAEAEKAWEAGEAYDLDAKLKAIDDEYDKIFAEIERLYQEKVDEIMAEYGRMIQDVWFNALKESDLGYLFGEMYEMALKGANWSEIYNAALGLDQSDNGLFSIFGTSDTTKVADALGKMISEMGGAERVMAIIEQYNKSGNAEKAGVLQAMLDTYYATGGIVFDESLSKGSEETAKKLWDVYGYNTSGRISYGLGSWLEYLYANLQTSDFMSPLKNFTLDELIEYGIAIPGKGNRFGIDFDKYLELMQRLEVEQEATQYGAELVTGETMKLAELPDITEETTSSYEQWKEDKNAPSHGYQGRATRNEDEFEAAVEEAAEIFADDFYQGVKDYVDAERIDKNFADVLDEPEGEGAAMDALFDKYRSGALELERLLSIIAQGEDADGYWKAWTTYQNGLLAEEYRRQGMSLDLEEVGLSEIPKWAAAEYDRLHADEAAQNATQGFADALISASLGASDSLGELGGAAQNEAQSFTDALISASLGASESLGGLGGAAQNAASALNAIGGQDVPGMATGGRADRPVLFGEAGPEWFIPEKHDSNTARLILAAAAASGFGWDELMDIAGGQLFAEGGSYGSTASLSWPSLNGAGSADSESSAGLQIQYSPVIHADNAEGVERTLIEDKKRLEKQLDEWWRKRKLYETIASYS